MQKKLLEKSIFKKIIDGDLPSDKVFENDRILAIKDIAPVAPVHLLIIPKKCIESIQKIQPEDLPLLQEVVAVAQKLAEEYGVSEGYRLLTNCGSEAGQTIFHLHFHLIGGRALGPMA
ncbi:MAG: histidine triad nucleotide-binding protein [Chlamydiia bacterium]|nr:histidine triad nucleotide-binding protein [Chlamydiia bacterium]MCP5492688.1 histidine triad nucleotide-binding protein [Chlamydiales bacterium]